MQLLKKNATTNYNRDKHEQEKIIKTISIKTFV